MRTGLVLSTFLLMTVSLHAQTKPTPEGIEFFEKHVRPVFAEHCYSCHGEKKEQAGLRLDLKTRILKGSDSGPVIVSGEPDKSLLIKSIRHEGDYKMPPKMKLTQPAIDMIATWVKMGVPMPDDAVIKPVDTSKTHWAFQPINDPTPPPTKQLSTQPLDRFVQAKLEAQGQTRAKVADRRTLIRRSSLDLTGLPPTYEEIEQFINDAAPNAYEKLIDRLLESPHYGEQQARHWMDVARYADTKGYVFQEDRNYPNAYTYRDWLIRSFNDDLPYDQFIINQLAADRVPKNDPKNLAAMGFLTTGRRFLNNTADIIDDRLDVTFRGFQGLTVVCSRCHDHKYDPIPTKDYYSLYGVFASSIEPKDLPLIETPKDTPETRAFEVELKKREVAVNDATTKLRSTYLDKLKTAPVLAEYLRTVRDVKTLNTNNMGTLAAERKLLAVALTAWQTYLDKQAKPTSPVFGIYHQLSKIADAEFATKGVETLNSLLKETDPKKLNPLVKVAFQTKAPKSFTDACGVYGELLANHRTSPKGAITSEQTELLAVLGEQGVYTFDDRQFMRILTVAEQNQLRGLRRKVDEWKAKSPAAPARAMVLNDGPKVEPVVFVRGNPGNHGPRVPRQFLEVLSKDRKPFADGSGRLEMAQAIANPQNPLTARVMVNRIWGHLFGQGLVRTPSDFGVRSDPPTHPELLDWLAKRFVESGWSMKKMHKLIMLSETYQQSSAVSAEQAKLDPENRWLGRMSRKRMTFEMTRDSVLYTAGKLDQTVGGRSIDLFASPFTTRRAVYGFIDRQNLPGTLRTFDFASPDAHTPQRFVTTVPQQALFLMNSPFMLEQAKALAKRADETETTARINELYQISIGRSATNEELAIAREYINQGTIKAPADVWQYGWGQWNEKTNSTVFNLLPHDTGKAKQGGPTLPDPTLGWCTLNPQGGHPGNDQQHAVIRRWIALDDGEVTINGTLTHTNKEGDGVRGRIVVRGASVLGDWKALNTKVSTTVKSISVKQGDTIDLITDCLTSPTNDSFGWTVNIQLKAKSGLQTFDSAQDFNKPSPSKLALDVWEQLAQVLLLSNEFAFIE